MSGPEGIIESMMVEKETKALQTEAVDCKWFIQAPPGSKVNIPQIILTYSLFAEYTRSRM